MKKFLLPLLVASSLQLSSQFYTAGTHFSNYHNIFPDTLLAYQNYPFTNNTYSLNVFGTPGYELEFTARGSVSPGGSQAFIRIQSLNPDIYVRFGRLDSVYAPGSSNWNVTKVALPLSSGDTINAPAAIWDKGELYLTDHTGSQGGNKNVNDFVGGDKYIGLKYAETDNYGTNDYYGWIWVRCTSEDSCYIKEYSGMTKMTGLIELDENKIQIFPNPVNNLFYLKGVNVQGFDRTSLRIDDLMGKTIPFSAVTSGETIAVKLSDAAVGIYFLSYVSKDKMITRKIVKIQ